MSCEAGGGASSEAGASCAAAAAAPPARAQPGQLLISVKDPVKKAEAGLIFGLSGGYVLYRVDSRSLLPGYRRERNSVRRRFRDFVVYPQLQGFALYPQFLGFRSRLSVAVSWC